MAAGDRDGITALRHVDVTPVWYISAPAASNIQERNYPWPALSSARAAFTACLCLFKGPIWSSPPTLLVADFDSLDAAPAFDHILRLPVEKDDTDMIRAVKEGFDRGEREFHLLGGMGGHRTDHTVANMQTLAYIARRGGQGWLYGNGERFTAICDGGEITLTAGQNSVFSVFCLGADAEGVTIENAKYPLTDAVLTADFPLGVSNHFIGQAVRVAVRCGCLLIGITDKE